MATGALPTTYWRGEPHNTPLAMPTQLTESQVKALLYELCVRLGFCLPPIDQRRLEGSPPSDVEAFADAVYAAEGADPSAHPHIRKAVCECIASHFVKAAKGIR
jgi:hypothetical protein